MALSTLPEGDAPYLIHHSDRGTQYACYRYVDTLVGHHIRISMTECYKPTDNAIADAQDRNGGVMEAYPDCDYAKGIRELAKAMLAENGTEGTESAEE